MCIHVVHKNSNYMRALPQCCVFSHHCGFQKLRNRNSYKRTSIRNVVHPQSQLSFFPSNASIPVSCNTSWWNRLRQSFVSSSSSHIPVKSMAGVLLYISLRIMRPRLTRTMCSLGAPLIGTTRRLYQFLFASGTLFLSKLRTTVWCMVQSQPSGIASRKLAVGHGWQAPFVPVGTEWTTLSVAQLVPALASQPNSLLAQALNMSGPVTHAWIRTSSWSCV